VDFLSHPLLQSLKLVDLPPYLIKSSIFGEWKEEGPIYPLTKVIRISSWFHCGACNPKSSFVGILVERQSWGLLGVVQARWWCWEHPIESWSLIPTLWRFGSHLDRHHLYSGEVNLAIVDSSPEKKARYLWHWWPLWHHTSPNVDVLPLTRKKLLNYVKQISRFASLWWLPRSFILLFVLLVFFDFLCVCII
jgi:hypothetical protein